MFSNNRPKIKIELETIDVIIEFLSVTCLIIMWLYLLMNYWSLPDTIPTHFNAKGEADGFSSKHNLWLLPLLNTGIYVLLFVLCSRPHLHNYMVSITVQNAERQYKFSSRFLRIVNFCCVLLLSYIVFLMIRGAQDSNSNIGIVFWGLVITISVVLPIIALVYQQKNK